MQTCENCENWVHATAECCVVLSCDIFDLPISVEETMEKDFNVENECGEYKELI